MTRPTRRRHRRPLLVVAALGGVLLFGYGLHDAFPAPPPGSAMAGTVAQRVNALASDLGHQEHALTGCGKALDTGSLGCFQAHDMAMASELSRFAGSVAKLTIGAAARPARTTALLHLDMLAQDLRALGTAPNAAQYQSVAAQRHIGPLGSTVDHDLQRLVAKVGSLHPSSAA